MVVRNAPSGPNITAGRMIIAFANARRTASSPSPRLQRSRTRIRADTGNMDKVLDPRPLRLNRYSSGSFDVHGMKCLMSMLNVKTDGIYHRVSASNGISD
jgi:hypothetical protein